MRYDGILICSDFDGTLVDESKVISNETREAIKMFQANGGRFTMATGRSPSFIAEVMADVMPNAPMIALNGSVLYDHDNNKELMNVIMQCNTDLLYSIYSSPQCIGCNIYDTEYKMTDLKKANGDGLEQLIAGTKENILKIVFIFEDTNTPRALCETLKAENGDDFYFCRSWAYSIEALDKSATKGNMLKQLKTIMPDIKTTIGVGDFENDIPLLVDADIGIAVANAIPEVIAAADQVTVSCDKDAIAKIIYEL